MRKISSLNHWYDGWFYDKLIAPNQDRMFHQIQTMIEPNSSVLDVGCGTGRFSFTIADKSKSVFGIDLSTRNIERAKSNLAKNPNDKISFTLSTVADLISQNLHFDYAVMTYVIHEVDEEERVKLLEEISNVADKIIIGDYLVPKPNGFWTVLNEVVEFLAGREHYHNFITFISQGGIDGLIKKTRFKKKIEIKNNPLTSQIVMLSK